jgi:uncharacterized protein YjbI with pentapeptide repeats
MATPKQKIKATKPKNIFIKPLEINFKELFTGLSKGIGHTITGKWEEIGTDVVETLSAIGLATDPSELAFLLIRRSITQALFNLVGESASQYLAETKQKPDEIVAKLDDSISASEIHIDKKFFDRPSELALLKDIKDLLCNWLKGHDIPEYTAEAITDRLPTYFIFELNQEWRKNIKSYRPLLESLDTPFAKAGEREWAWSTYSALLQRRVEEGIFDEPFSLRQIYIPLNAYYLEEQSKKESTKDNSRFGQDCRCVAVSLENELESWIENPTSQDAIRVISGGPGSGKSSFTKIFAANLSAKGKLKVLFIPLHLIDPLKDMADEVGRFVRDEGILDQNPLNPESPEPNLLIIFDGLDELANQGKTAAETARAFIREVYRTVEKRNSNSVRLRILISGRELVVQENESEFRQPRQILNLLPYYSGKPDELSHNNFLGEKYHDPNNLLKKDLRQTWWKNYGKLIGRSFDGLPKELARKDLEEITAQPLLNYLIALSFTRERIDFQKNVNLNEIYWDLVSAVHERGYEKKRPYAPIRNLTLKNFIRVLEEIGLAAWHGDGRTTTVREIEEHCKISGVSSLLEDFTEGAKAGVTRLLAAFFFRQYGCRASGDPTFVFTHKSFGEYLTARRVVRAMEKISRELKRRLESPDEGWDEKEALKHWAQICGPSAISQYLHRFLLDELLLREPGDIGELQNYFTKLFSYILRYGMPMELLQIPTFRISLFQARNAEEALLVALNACARLTKKISMIVHPDPTAFGAWFRRIQGQRTGPESCLTAGCLSFLYLKDTVLHIIDFYNANLEKSNLSNISASFINLFETDLREANLENAKLLIANLERVNLEGANLKEARLEKVNFNSANLDGASLEGANLKGANLEGADIEGAYLEGTNLEGANLKGAKLKLANLKLANLELANLKGANLEGANLERANLKGANLEGANLKRANLESANFERVNLEGANLRGANLEGTNLKGVILEKNNNERLQKETSFEIAPSKEPNED